MRRARCRFRVKWFKCLTLCLKKLLGEQFGHAFVHHCFHHREDGRGQGDLRIRELFQPFHEGVQVAFVKFLVGLERLPALFGERGQDFLVVVRGLFLFGESFFLACRPSGTLRSWSRPVCRLYS